MAKLNLVEIMEKKRTQSKSDKMSIKLYKSETLGCDIEVRKMPLSKYMDLVESMDEDGNSIDGMNKLIYEACPMFKENTKEAMAFYGVGEATDLPSAVLEDQINEMKDIVEIINSFYGVDKMDSETVKN